MNKKNLNISNVRGAQRDYSIDTLRGIAIVLVVFGHSIILYSSAWNIYTTEWNVPVLDYLKSIINLIQMPLFFSLSGYVFRFSLEQHKFFAIIKNKIRRILIPFLIFALAYLLPIRLIIGYHGYIGCSMWDIVISKIILGGDNGHLWYLPTLFLVFLISSALMGILKRNCRYDGTATWVQFGIGVCLYAVNVLVHTQFPYLQFIFQYYMWFSLGALISYYKTTKNEIYPKLCSYRAIFIVLSILAIWGALYIKFYPVKWAVSNIASLLCCVSMYICTPNKKISVLSFFSENSLGIYLIHSPLIYFTFTLWNNSYPGIVLVVNFVIFGGISLLLSAWIRSSKFKFILGE